MAMGRRRFLRGACDVAAAIVGTRLAAVPVRAAAGGSAVLQWNLAALQAIQAGHLGPPMVARALAVLHTCIYDAWALYDPVAAPVYAPPSLRQPEAQRTPENVLQAVNAAAYAALIDLFPTEQASFTALLTALGGSPAPPGATPGSAAEIGTLCAAAVLDARHGDGSNQLGDLHPGTYSDYTGYEPINTPDAIVDPDHWQPLRLPDGQGGSTVQQYIGPHWGLVTPFALTSGAQLRPDLGPALYGSPEYQAQADELLAISARLTDEQKVVTEYWADGPGTVQPPGHWMLFAQTVSRWDGHDLSRDVQLFFILSNVLLDAGIACWDAKRAWDSIRPISAVHYLYRGQRIQAWGGPFRGTVTILGEDWQVYQSPVVVTPAFPEFFSGHSTFSAAAAEILARFRDSDAFGAQVVIPAGSSALEPGHVPAADLTLSWSTFSAAADQAGMSRRFGGIHFPLGDLTGRAVGRKVGAAVWDRARGYLAGSG